MNKKEKLVIVISGIKAIATKYHIFKTNKFINNIIKSFYNFFSIKNQKDFTNKRYFLSKFNSKDRKVIFLHWGRGINPFSKYFAKRKLKRLINKYQNKYSITLVGMSLGGEIAIETVQSLKDNFVKKIILIASTNEVRYLNFNDCKIINIYSPTDYFSLVASKIMAPIHGSLKLSGKNIINIPINNFKHDTFFSNNKIKNGKFKGKTVTQVVNYLLDR